MILTSFLLGNLVALCMKIINSVVVVGLYYGFLTTFSIGPSYLFLLRAQVMEEGTERKVSATTGFITGQLMMLISIYYAPLHLALGRPHTITVLALPHLLFHFFWNNQKHFFDSRSTNRNSMRNLSIQCVFLNNLIFQLFNYFLLPSSMLARLVNIYMFRCNNKMLFVTSSFVGWLIGHVLFMKWVGLVLVWIRQNHSIRSNVLIRSNKYLVSEVRNSMARIFSIFLFITCVYYLGRIPSSMVLKETSVTEERGESREETDVEIEKTSKTKWTKEEQEGSTEEDPSPSLFSEEKEDPDKIDETEEIRVNGKEKTKDEFHFYFKETCYQNSPVYETSYLYGNKETSKLQILKKKEKKLVNTINIRLVALLFDYKRWKRPFRYLKNKKFESSIINEMSQYFFFSCQDNEKKRISFTYPPSFKTFFEMLERKMFFFRSVESVDSISDELENPWVSKTEQNKKKLRTEFLNRLETLERGSRCLDVLTRLRIYKTKKKYLLKKNDPILNGPYRESTKRIFSPPPLSENSIKKRQETPLINKIHGLILANNFIEFEEIINMDDKKRNKFLVGIKEISKKIPRRSYKLIDELECQEREYETAILDDAGMRSRTGRFILVFTITEPTYTNSEPELFYLMHYSKERDFCRNIIIGSIRAQRRKIPIFKLSQGNVSSPLFLYKLEKSILSYFDISGLIKKILRNWIKKTNEFDLSEKNEKYKREATIEIEMETELENGILTSQVKRSCILIMKSILRKYIILPLLIIAKNIGRILLFQFPEWSEDFENWNKEKHVKCTYSGVELSEKDLPKNWLSEGIQIKILFPFYLKPWHRSKSAFPQMDRLQKKEKKKKMGFLNVWGRPTKHPFGSPQNQPSFFVPILKVLKKKMRKLKTNFFFILQMLKVTEIKKWINKSGPFINRLINDPSKKNGILLFGLSELDEWGETKNEKDWIKNKNLIHESPIPTRSKNRTKHSLIEIKMQDMTIKTSTIRNQLEKILKEKKKYFRTSEINNRFNKKRHAIKRLELKKRKIICQIVKKQITRLIFNLQYFIQFFIERISIAILLVINIIRTKGQPFFHFESKKPIDKYTYNNEANKKEKKMDFRNFRQSCFYISKKNAIFIFDLSSLSQAYVGYKLSQSHIFNLYNFRLKSALQYHKTSLFIKDEIKDDFEVQRIFDSELTDKKFITYGKNQWKSWLQNHYQYNISHIRWSGLVPKKWKNKKNRRSISIRQNENKDLLKWDFYENDGLIRYEKEIYDYRLNSLSNHKGNLKKNSRYDLLSYKSINYENKKTAYIFVLPSEVKNNQKRSYNSNTNKIKLFTLGDNNSLGEKAITDMDKSFFYYRIIHLCLRKRLDSEAWIQTNTTNTKISNYQLIEEIDKRDLFSFPNHQTEQTNLSIQSFFDWLGMNEEFPILNEEFWFLPELILFYNVYKRKIWMIPIKSLLLNFNEKKSLSQKKNIAIKHKWNRGSLLLNQEKDVSDYSVQSDRKKRIKKRNPEEDLDFFLTSQLLVQLRWSFFFNLTIMKNIKVYCLLLSLRNPRESALSAIQRGTINLDIMPSHTYVTEWMQRGVFFIEPVRMSINNPGQFLMYQTIRISLVHKNYYQTNSSYREKAKEQKIIGNRDIKNSSLLVLETILSPRRRKELRILISFNSKKTKSMDLNLVFCNRQNVKNYDPFLVERNRLHRLKFFLWPTCQLEDLVCMNRYWFNTNTGSSFSMLRIHMYP
uniref:Protein TIC 214 n=1 Tax=Sinocrassula densirosulata TaxID=595263 RepID=A0A7U0QDG5_9MAGN|nr:Ycf1 protein [Sinocrassula densirosulata]QQW47485.1 Ycf1 protein [Sinocrassula densirosulata]